MFDFLKKKHFLGVDFGTFSIKIVEIKMEKGRAKLVNFGIADVHDEEITGVTNTISHEARRRKYFSALLQRMQPKTKQVCVSIPGSSGLIAVVEFPQMKEKELAEAVRFEAHKYVPIDMNDVVLSWDVLRNTDQVHKEDAIEKVSQGMKKVLLVAALKKDVERTAEAVQQAGYAIGGMELEVFSLARSLVGKDPGTHLIIDVGFRVCNLILVRDGEVHINRTVDVGGGDITKTIADGMNISFDRAEALKKEKDFFHQVEIPLTFPAIDIILNEVRRIIATASRQSEGGSVDSLILSGGSANLPGLGDYFSEKIGVPAVKGNPWRQIAYDSKQGSSAEVEAAGESLAIALGLALRSVEIDEEKKGG